VCFKETGLPESLGIVPAEDCSIEISTLIFLKHSHRMKFHLLLIGNVYVLLNVTVSESENEVWSA